MFTAWMAQDVGLSTNPLEKCNHLADSGLSTLDPNLPTRDPCCTHHRHCNIPSSTGSQTQAPLSGAIRNESLQVRQVTNRSSNARNIILVNCKQGSVCVCARVLIHNDKNEQDSKSHDIYSGLITGMIRTETRQLFQVRGKRSSQLVPIQKAALQDSSDCHIGGNLAVKIILVEIQQGKLASFLRDLKARQHHGQNSIRMGNIKQSKSLKTVKSHPAVKCRQKRRERLENVILQSWVRLLLCTTLRPFLAAWWRSIGKFNLVPYETSFRVKTCRLVSLAALTQLQTAPFYSMIQCFQQTSTPYPAASYSSEAPIAIDAVFHPNKWFSLPGSQSFYPYRRN